MPGRGGFRRWGLPPHRIYGDGQEYEQADDRYSVGCHSQRQLLELQADGVFSSRDDKADPALALGRLDGYFLPINVGPPSREIVDVEEDPQHLCELDGEPTGGRSVFLLQYSGSLGPGRSIQPFQWQASTVHGLQEGLWRYPLYPDGQVFTCGRGADGPHPPFHVHHLCQRGIGWQRVLIARVEHG